MANLLPQLCTRQPDGLVVGLIACACKAALSGGTMSGIPNSGANHQKVSILFHGKADGGSYVVIGPGGKPGLGRYCAALAAAKFERNPDALICPAARALIPRCSTDRKAVFLGFADSFRGKNTGAGGTARSVYAGAKMSPHFPVCLFSAVEFTAAFAASIRSLQKA